MPKTCRSPILAEVSSSGLYQDSTDETLPPSHQLTVAALNKCTFLSTQFQNIAAEEHYDLGKLFSTYNMNCDEAMKQYTKHVHGATSSEYDTAVWILGVLYTHERQLYGCYTGERKWLVSSLPKMKDRIAPMITNLSILTDCLIEVKVASHWVAVVIIEKHSSTSSSTSTSYRNSVCKTVSNVVDMFRVLRLHNAELEKVYGFCFPKMGTDSMVTKVEVSFDVQHFSFKAKCIQLVIGDVQSEVLSVFASAVKYLPSTCDKVPSTYFLRLNEKELDGMKNKLELDSTDYLLQEPTTHSVLLQNGKYFFKLILHDNLVSTIPSHTCEHIIQLTKKPIGNNLLMYSSPALIPPLAPGEIQMCLSNFMVLVAAALQSLHDLGYAHLDVRVPNVCFKRNQDNAHIAVLIDLDRASPAENLEAAIYKGEMYEKKGSRWSHAQLDWRQLGILGCRVSKEYDDPFLSNLQEQGKAVQI